MTVSSGVPAASPQTVASVVARLRATYDSGVTLPRAARRRHLADLRRLLVEGADQLSAALTSDLGKPPTESWLTEIGIALSELDLVVANLERWTAPRRVRAPLYLAPASASLVREPLGVVAIIAPWNYPVNLVLTPLVGALAAGNTAVLKPSEIASATSRALADLASRHLDPDVVGVVQGEVETTTALLDQRLDHIFFTGGGSVGRVVAAAAAKNLTPVTLELGGRCPVWVDPGQDLAAVGTALAWAKLVNAGQTCIAPNHVFTTPGAAAELSGHVGRAVTDMYGPDPALSADYGRMVNVRHLERVAALVDDTLAAGATLVRGGERDAAERYLAPTVLTDVAADHPIMGEEIFGPVLPIRSVSSLDEMIAETRAGDHPLAAYAFTDVREHRTRIARELRAGALTFGAPMLHFSVPGLPFGGVGESGTGAYHGEASVRTFSHDKAVLSRSLVPDTLSLIRPPFTRVRGRLARLLVR